MADAQAVEVRESGVLRAAGVIGFATFLSRISGLVREQVIAILFGAGNATDAFNLAFRIPNLLRNLFAEGAMSASLVPTFSRARIEEGDRRAWRVAGLVFRVLFAGVGLLAALGMLFAPQLVGLYGSAFHAVPGKFELTVEMTRTMFPFFPLVALAAAFMGILNACEIFFLPALSSALFNIVSVLVGVILAEYVFKGTSVHPMEGMAIGVLVGGAVQAFCQLPLLYRVGYRWSKKEASDPTWHQDPALRRMLSMMIPGTVGLAATQVSILVNTILATSQGPGAVSWLNYAFRLMQFPIGIFGVSIASATLPRVSKLWVERDIRGVEVTVSQSLRHVFAINLPASAGLAFLAYPIIELIFQYGRFYPEDTSKTAMALAMYSLGLTAYSMVKVLVPACYALGNTRLPVISSFLSILATILLNVAMVGELGFVGLALGTSIGAILNAILLVVILRKLVSDFRVLPLLRAFAEHLGVALAMGGACLLSYKGLQAVIPDRIFIEAFGRGVLPLIRAARVALLMAEGLFLVGWMARLFKLRDTTEALDFFLKKMKNKLSRLRN